MTSLTRGPSTKRHGAESAQDQPVLRRSSTLKDRSRVMSKSFKKGIHEVYFAFDGKRSPWDNRPYTSLRTSEVKALINALTLPLSTPMITTKIADLGKTLTRHEFSRVPRELCKIHTWFEPKYVQRMTDLIASELWDRSEGLFAFPEKSLDKHVQRMLYKDLLIYKNVFKTAARGSKVQIVKTPEDAWKGKPHIQDESCLACNLNRFLSDTAAVEAICTLCKGRKKKGYTWPELLAFLAPIEYGKNEHWRRDFIKSSRHVMRTRRRVNIWRDCGGDEWIATLKKSQDWEAGEEVPIVFSPTHPSECQDDARPSPDLSGETLHEGVPEFDDDLEEHFFTPNSATPSKREDILTAVEAQLIPSQD